MDLEGKTVVIKRATTGDAKALAANMETADVEECHNVARLSPRAAIRRCMDRAPGSRALVVNGEVVAIWGVRNAGAGLGYVWLLTSKAVRKHPILFAKLYQHQVTEMLTTFKALVNFIDGRHQRAIKMAQMLGAELAEPAPFGPNRHLCTRATWLRPGVKLQINQEAA